MNDKPFFVGYAPMPSSEKRLFRAIIVVVVVGLIALALLLSSGQQAAGKGQWNPSVTNSLEGFLTADPYPVLHRADGTSVLLVRSGKAPVDEFISGYVGQPVRLRGAPIERGGWYMLELHSAADVMRWEPDSHIPVPEAAMGPTIELHGEIVDSKCFLGVMKPGAGKVHRACAAMCLTGGMPPMLVVTDEEGDKYGYLLTTEAGGSASKVLVPDVAVPVTVTGELIVKGDLTYLRLSGAVKRRSVPSSITAL